VDAAVVDCVLLDLTLPDGSGFDLLERWRSEGNAVPIIVITARSAVEDRLAGLDGGADDFVIKPFATAELISRIRAVLRRSARQTSERWTLGALTIEPRATAACARASHWTCRRANSSCCWSWRASRAPWWPRACWRSGWSRWASRWTSPRSRCTCRTCGARSAAHAMRTVRGVGYMLAS
jgi:hypothetical protein